MTGSALMDFLIGLVGLCVAVYLVFLAIDRIAPDVGANRIAKCAVGGGALILALLAIKGVIFGGGGVQITGSGLIEFAIGLLVLMVVLYLVYLLIDFWAPEPYRATFKYVIGMIALIAILVLAGQIFYGGGIWLGQSGGVRRGLLDAALLLVA